MHFSELIAFLGHSPEEPAFSQWLTAHRVQSRPHSAQDDDEFEDDPDQADQNAEASLIDEAEHLGICLIYDDFENQQRLYGDIPGRGAFVLEQLALYAQDVQAYQAYEGDLPGGVCFGQTRDQVQRAWGKPLARRTVHELPADLYRSGPCLLDASFIDDALAIVHVRRLHRFDRCMLGIEQPLHDAGAVDPAALARLLGGSAYRPELIDLLAPLGWVVDRDTRLAQADDVMDLLDEHGVTLYFRDARDFPALKRADFPRDHAVFAGFRLSRCGDMHGHGYRGSGPLGIEFHHTPPQVLERVALPPDWQQQGPDIGAYRWHLTHCTLQVMYSLLDWQVYRISCFAPFMKL